MQIKEIISDFKSKLRADSFTDNDFLSDMRPFLKSFLTGKSRQHTREKFLAADGKVIVGEEKFCVILKCPDDEYRFDFITDMDGKWRICFVECITLPVHDITELPYANFNRYAKESWIRAENNISRMIYQYVTVKSFDFFRDGGGNVLAAESWVPFYTKRKAFIAYNAWYECRINGEHVIIDEFDDDICILRFTDHLWLRVYNAATHIKTVIPFEEYMALFEYIWNDRATAAGWKINYTYDFDKNITIMQFRRLT